VLVVIPLEVLLLDDAVLAPAEPPVPTEPAAAPPEF
jgi:hypothetical protein